MELETQPPIHNFEASDLTVTPLPPPTKIYVGLCSRDWQVEHYTAECVRHFGRQCKAEIHVGYMANDGVARSRNNLAANFLETDCTHLLFLDNDIVAMPRHLDLLIDANKLIVCGFYPKKQPMLDWVVNYLPNEAADANGLMKVRHAGTGFMLIAREVFTTMAEKLPEIAYGGDPSPESKRWDFFPMYAKDGMYKSEDWFFCERAQQCGYEIWMHTGVQLRHVGKIVYPLQFTLTDEDMVDLMHHRYGISHDLVRTFIGSGMKSPCLMGGNVEKPVRLWPKDFPENDLHHGAELAGLYDMPEFPKETKTPTILDVGADCGAYAIYAAKRWAKCTLVGFEPDEGKYKRLTFTLERLREKHKDLVATYHQSGFNPDLIGQPSIVKIETNQREREVLEILNGTGKLDAVDYVVIRYFDDTVPMVTEMMLNGAFFRHCNQMLATGGGVLKYISRRLIA